MKSIGQNVGDITADDRQVLENFLGHKLRENQRVVIQVMDADPSKTNGGDFQAISSGEMISPGEIAPLGQNGPLGTNLEDWAIFRDMSDEEVAELEAVILERSPSRDVDI